VVCFVVRVNRFIAVTLNKLCLLQFPLEMILNAVQPRFSCALVAFVHVCVCECVSKVGEQNK